jgi:hypothetical protein
MKNTDHSTDCVSKRMKACLRGASRG